MRIYLILLVASLYAIQIQAQIISLNRNQVIASNGLNLRSEPSRDSEVLTKIPFKEVVKVLSKELSATDSTNFRLTAHLSGWAKVAYKSYTGYVWDDYLYYSNLWEEASKQDILGAASDSKYCIQSSRQAVLTHKIDEYQWLGIFESNKLPQVKRVYPEYYYAPSEIQENLGIRITGNTQPSLIIGYAHDEPFPPVPDVKFNSSNRSTNDEMKAKSISLLGKLAIDISDTSDLNSSYLLNINKDISFKLIQAVGDFDGDGQTDFIATYRHKLYDVTDVYVLFLTKKAIAPYQWKAVAACNEYNGC